MTKLRLFIGGGLRKVTPSTLHKAAERGRV